MPYYSLRLTPSKISQDSTPLQYRHLFRQIVAKYDVKQYALAWEKLNKYLEDTTPHYHFNFITDSKQATIRAFVTRWDDFGTIKGKEMYALSSFPEPNDTSRWWRYIFKENCIAHLGIDDVYDISNISLLAMDERKRSSLWNIEKREKKEAKNSQYLRYEKKVETFSKKNPLNQAIIFTQFLSHTIQDNKVVNYRQLLGFTHLYMIKHKYMTPIQFYNLHLTSPYHNT